MSWKETLLLWIKTLLVFKKCIKRNLKEKLYYIPTIFKRCGLYDCNIFGCNCDTTCYKGRCGYCYKCNLNIDLGKLNIGVAGEGSVSAKIGTKEKTFDFSREIVPLHDGNLECCGSGCRRRRRSLQDMILVSSSLTFGHSEKQSFYIPYFRE